MQIAIYILAIIITFFFMEFVAWVSHKYLMHGLLWILHRDHHQGHTGFFERNDAFFLIFALPSMILMYFGVLAGNDIKLFIGIGIALYGFCYFMVHEIFIHQRFKIFRNSNNWYLRAIRRAHKMHHKHFNKEDGECFGMLLVPLKYFREEKS
jgi:beta-carotene 3-hydroxylase